MVGDLWVRRAADLPLPGAPAVLSAPGGVIVRVTDAAVDLVGVDSAAELIGLDLGELLSQEDAVCRVPGGAVVRPVSWPHVVEPRLLVTLLVEVSDLVSPLGELPAELRGWPLELQRFARVGAYPLRDAQRQAKIGTWEWDPTTGAMWLSELLRELIGVPTGEPFNLDDFLRGIHPEDRERVRTALTGLIERDHNLVVEFRMLLPQERVFRVHGTAMRLSGEPFALVGTAQDVTEQRRPEQGEEEQPTRDEVTGLLDRTAALGEIARLDADPRADAAVLCCGIDNFKRVTISLGGHEAGDELLAALARRLQDGVPDGCAVVRGSGEDEFVIFCPDVAAVGGLGELTGRVSGLLRTTVPVHGHLIQVSAAIGVAVRGANATSGADLLRFANAAMVEAEGKGGAGQVAFAGPATMAAADWQLPLEERLREALHEDGLELHYQPLVAADGTILGAEALVRWHYPEHGPVSPATFLPVAERGGLLRDLDRWVLRTALREAAGWRLPDGGGPLIALNLAELVPGDADFVGVVESVVTEAGIDWHRIILELVESDLVDLRPRARGGMRELAERGARFAIDDFGTGYSSLGRLKELPAQIIKIDRRFVAAVEQDTADFAVTRAIVDMARAMGRWCVAEGVETASQVSILSALGVEFYQGWAFSPAVPAERFRELLADSALPPPER
ncbi:putative bifunctional diguanylate cyclase/phosphodiesterase [Saccharopolyspora cebuensis]|uniref:putative bifunctional diguanylate cyclase/phosphodiesterase n=1 Tax=Saccharopolyspora cebuensis TaxID=418759 RepID=UPI0031EA9F1F